MRHHVADADALGRVLQSSLSNVLQHIHGGLTPAALAAGLRARYEAGGVFDWAALGKAHAHCFRAAPGLESMVCIKSMEPPQLRAARTVHGTAQAPLQQAAVRTCGR